MSEQVTVDHGAFQVTSNHQTADDLSASLTAADDHYHTPAADPSDETHNSSGETNMSKVERTKAEIRADKAAAKAEKEAAKALEPKVEKAPKAPRAPAEWSDLPEGEHQQEPRPDSVASKTLLLIDANQGATLDEIQAEIGEKHSARRLLTWMNKERGYGFTMTDGKILYQANNVTIPVPAPKAKPVAE